MSSGPEPSSVTHPIPATATDTQESGDVLDGALTRRRFLRGSATAAVTLAAAGVAGCRTGSNTPGSSVSATTAPTALPPTGHAPTVPTAEGGLTWEEMDRMHEAGVKAFPAKTAGLGGQLLAPVMDGDVKVFNLEAAEMEWEVEPGKHLPAFGYNGQVPGPEIRVVEGDTVRVVLTNKLDQSTSIHFHGVIVPNAMDGVPYITQPPVRPGETFTYEFVVRNPGSHMYHSHHNAAAQVTKGLLGAFIIEPLDPSQDPEHTGDYTMILNDSGQGFTINGKSFPATQPLTAKLGDRIRIRYMNEGLLIHPMHLHGMPQEVFAKDGWNLAQPFKCDTLNVAPGERWDVIVDCTEPGVWAFHCHILSHAESAHGMFGMVTALIVEQ